MLVQQRKQLLHQRPGHDMQGIAGKDRIKRAALGLRPAAARQIESHWQTQIGRRKVCMPGRNACMQRGQLTGLPDQMRQVRCKVHAVLARAGANF